MRILFLSRWYPYPSDNGSKIRVAQLLRGLCERHEVTLISFQDPAEPAAEPPAAGAPAHVLVSPFRDFEPASWRAIRGFGDGRPRFLVDTHSADMERLIRQTVRERRFDLVIASQLSMAAYHRAFAGVPAIFEEVELGVYRPSGPAPRSPWTRLRRELTWAKHRRFMARLVPSFALCTVASEVERRLLAEAVPGWTSVHVVPNTVSGESSVRAPDKEPDSLIFAGSLRYGPNRDALGWFLDEVFPEVRARVPGVRLIVTGDAGTGPLPSAPDLVLTGRVDDVRALVARAAVSLAPIREGGGTRLKVLEAMAVGTPVVATSKAVEGLDVRDGEHLLIGDSPGAFAGAVHRLLGDPAGAAELAARASRLFRARYDASVVIPEFLRIVERAAAA